MDPIDGNALAGPLACLFTPDLTSARGICAGCGQPSLLAETRVYDQAPGLAPVFQLDFDRLIIGSG
jgi:hypothetical protein